MAQVTGKKPSQTLLYHITPTGREVASCQALGKSILPPQKMVFPIWINDHRFTSLFDSGSSHCFLLGLSRTPSLITAVATADADHARVLGCSNFTCRWGRLPHAHSPEIPSVHILDQLCPGIGLIVGDFFLNQEHVVLDYAAGRCSLGVLKRTLLDVEPAHPEPL